MPGAGKTTMAPLLADKLGWNLIDTDDEIESAAGKSCQFFFSRFWPGGTLSGKKAFDRGGPVWPPRSNSKYDH